MSMHVRKTWLFLTLMGIASAICAGAFFFVSRSSEEPPQSLVSFEGFSPGARISYKIISNGEEILGGESETNREGSLDIPAPSKLSRFAKAPVTYDFTFSDDLRRDLANIRMTLDPAQRSAAVSGAGLAELSPVTLESGVEDAISSRADWAGRLNERGPWNDNYYKIALGGDHALGDFGENLRIIRVFTAPGGGTASSSNVNAYDNIFCEDGRIPSTCEASPMSSQIQNLKNNYARAFMLMTEQLSAVMMQQMQIIGSFLDAKQQLETQRLIQQMNARAHKDYHPSEMMCQIGSFMKSMAKADQTVDYNKLMLSQALMATYNNTGSMAGGQGSDVDAEARIKQFRTVYCDPKDNGSGLGYMCEHSQQRDLTGDVGAPKTSDGLEHINSDIDYSTILDFPLTISVNFPDGSLTPDEQDAIALARNLYWPKTLQNQPGKEAAENNKHMNARRVFAITNVAHNSFAHIVGMKAETMDHVTDAANNNLGSEVGWSFMKAMLRNFIEKEEWIDGFIGVRPSYWAQMDVLTKQMFQHPDFYTDLIDTPANIERINASLEAIRVMQQRDMFESRQRQEMLNSMMVEVELAPLVDKINDLNAEKARNVTRQ